MRIPLGLALVTIAFSATPASAKPGVAVPATTLPKVSAPIPVTTTSRPFLGAAEAMAKVGYVEEEFFLTGLANTYDWTGVGRGVKVIAGPGKYVTRILVRRPRDPKRFGGNVELMLLNASLNADTGGPIDFANMVRNGDVWIGITTKTSTTKALKAFDPARYAPLDWSNPAPPERRCALPTMIPPFMIGSKAIQEAMAKAGLLGSWPENEDGLVWDMLGQLGHLLKSEQRASILPGFAKPHVYMTGISQSSIYMRTWVAGFHDRFRDRSGKPVYDGYIAIVGPAMIRINQCAADMALEDPLQKLPPPDVPFISISSEGEMWQARHTRQGDAFTRRGGIVSYEIAGSSHGRADYPGAAPDMLSFPSAQDFARAGVSAPAGPIPAKADGTVQNNLPWAPVLRGAWRNLILWSRKGVRPPQSSGIALDAELEIVRDEHGNAIGGVRGPYIDVPTATHTGYMTVGGIGGIPGTKTPFSPEKLRMLYPDQATYAAKFARETDRLLKGRWITPEDAAAMKAAAEKSPKL